ncbi:hypothetical protein ABDK00_014120 [Niabella insulamsoli]|uniref:hypothetical protein n=1 Tax=Niabella insulamsoli TaxID=3144874 RepID=UPI0031FDB638
MKTGKYKVTGLSKGNRFTFENNNGTWWAKSAMPDDRFQALFEWAKSDKGFWFQNILANVSYEELSWDGTPIDGKVVGIEVEFLN